MGPLTQDAEVVRMSGQPSHCQPATFRLGKFETERRPERACVVLGTIDAN